MSDREQILERLLEATWNALPFIISEHEGHEVDWEALQAINDEVQAVLGRPRMVVKNVTQVAVPRTQDLDGR